MISEVGAPLGAVPSSITMTTDASLTGCESDGRLEVKSSCFGPEMFPQGLIKMDNPTTVASINLQGGARSPQLHNLAQQIIMWRSSRFLSLCAVYIPGVWTKGADLMP